MRLDLVRIYSNSEETLGMLYINGLFSSWILEDEFRTKKIMGETRIPAGIYAIGRRYYGKFHKKYLERFPEFHDGVLEVLDVPNFTDILIHTGNTEKDTAGCLLVAMSANIRDNGRVMVTNSTISYRHIYPIIIAAMNRDEQVTLTITNEDKIRKLNA